MRDFIDKSNGLIEIIQLKEPNPVNFDLNLEAFVSKHLNLPDEQRVVIDSVEMPGSDYEPVVLKIKGRVTNKP